MNLHQLNVFRTIVETGSFSKAASELRIAQSAVSYHVKMLEAELGGPVFSRVKTRVFLTEKGQKLWKHVERIFQSLAEAQRDLSLGTSMEAGELHFGLGVYSLCDQVPGFVRRVQQACPGVSFSVVMGSTPQIVTLLRARNLDLGVVSLPVQDPDIWTTTLFHEEEEMLVVTSPNSPLAGLSEISAADLRGLPLILYNKTTATRNCLDNFFRESNISPVVFMEVDREDMIMLLVRSGLGLSILPRSLFAGRTDNDGLHFLRLRNAYLRREVGMAALGSEYRPPLVDLAVQLCEQHFTGGAAVPAHAQAL